MDDVELQAVGVNRRRPTSQSDALQQRTIDKGREYLRVRGYDPDKPANRQMTRTEKTSSNDAFTDDTAQRAVFPIGILLLAGFSLFVTVVSFLGALAANAIPLTLLTAATVGGYFINRDWRRSLEALDSGDDDKVDKIIKEFNLTVKVNNGFWTLQRYSNDIWNLTIGTLWLLFQLFVDIFIEALKFLFGTPALRKIVINLLVIGMQLFKIVVQALAALLMALSNSGTFGAFGAGTAPDSGSAAEQDEFRSERNFIIVGGQIVIESLVVIIRVFGPSYLTYLEWWFNVFVKVIPVVLKAVMFLLELLDPTKPFGMMLFSILRFNFSAMNYLATNCLVQKAHATMTCWQSAIFATSVNHVIKVVKKIPGVGGGLKTIDGCNPKKLNFNCRNAPDNPFTSGIFGAFGAGLCDEEECRLDVVGIIEELDSAEMDCAFWLDTDVSTPFCLAQVEEYSLVNSSSTAKADIDTIASELCFVLHEQIFSRCVLPAPPFSFDFDAAAQAICVDDKSGEPEPFNQVCACQFENPLCDMSCCEQYAKHVSGQVVEQIGTRTCGEMRAQFPEFGIWCPINETTQLSDFTFAHVWCNYFRMVLDPLCTSDLFLIQDLAIPAVLPAYVSDTCTRTVNQEGVCQPIDVGISELTADLIRDSIDLEPEELYAQNRIDNFVPGPITTIPQPGDSAIDIIFLNIDKYSCQQLSQFRNSSNPLWLSQEWSINHDLVFNCDNTLAAALAALSVQQAPDAQFRRRDAAGEFFPTNLEGIPASMPAFGSTVANSQANNCNFGIGQNEAELSDLQRCSGNVQGNMNRDGESLGRDGTGTLMGIQENAFRTADVDYLSGLSDPDPGDPEYDRKMRDMEIFDDVQSTPVSYSTPRASELDPNDRAEFRNPFLVNPPADGTFFDNDPLSVTYPTAAGGRTILALQGFNTRTEAEIGRLAMQKRKRQIQRQVLKFGASLMTSVRAREEGVRRSRKIRDEEADYFEGLKERMIMELEHARDNLPAILYGEDSPEARGAVKGGSSRRLLVFDESQLSAELQSLIDKVHSMPTTLGTITEAAFDVHIAETAKARFDYVFDVTMNIIVPKICQNFYELSTGNSSDSSDFLFGGTGENFDPNCRATVDNPLDCCCAKCTAYECCGKLFWCIRPPDESVFLDSVTPENLDDWRCRPYDSFFEEWWQAIRFVLDRLNSILKINIGTPPRNQLPCHYYNFWYLPLGILGSWLLKILLSTQQVAAIAIATIIFVNKETDKASDAADEEDASLFD